MESNEDNERELIACEIGGTDKGSIRNLLRKKKDQVAKCRDADRRCAGVVAFKQPEAALQTVG